MSAQTNVSERASQTFQLFVRAAEDSARIRAWAEQVVADSPPYPGTETARIQTLIEFGESASEPLRQVDQLMAELYRDSALNAITAK